MSEPTGETAQVVDANTASEDEINQALGLGETPDSEDTTDDPGQEPDDITKLPEFWQKEVNRLRRENAAARVKAREASKRTPPAPASGEAEKIDVEKIRAEARQEARLENGAKLAAAEIRGQLATVLPEDRVDDLIEDLNLSKYVDDDGEVDTDAVKALRDKYRSLLGKQRGPRPATAPQNTNTPKTEAEQFAEALGL